jgi:LacI family transcriptional regulator
MSSARKENVSVQFWPRDTQEETLRRWKHSHDKPTAIIFEEDKAAIEFENIAVQTGVNIPKDVSVLGIDNIPEAATAVVPLTTVEQPQYEQGLAATRVLFDMIRGKEPQHVVLQPKLVVRKSTSVPHNK